MFNFGAPNSGQSTGFGASFPTSQPSNTFGSGFSFGAPNTTTNTTDSGFGFNNLGTNASNPSNPFTFGQTSSAPSNTGFSFGQTNTSGPNTFGAQPSNTGFSFGAQPTSTNQSSGFGFGQTNTAPTNAFGTQPSTTTGFGDFSFGNPTNQQNTAFGQQPAASNPFATNTTSNPFNFGTTTTATQPSTSTGGFGFNFGNTTNPQPSTSSGFSFGSNQTTQPSTSGFGFGQQAAPTTSSNDAFGNLNFGFGTSAPNQNAQTANQFGFGGASSMTNSNVQGATPSEPQGPFQPVPTKDVKTQQPDGQIMNIVARESNKVGNNNEYFSQEEFRIKFMVQNNMLPKINPAISQSLLQLPPGVVATTSFNTQSNAPASSTGFSFGQPSTAPSQPTSGFGFGSNTAAPATDQSSYNFGFGNQPSNTTSTQQQPSNPFNFGAPATSAPTTTGFDFGIGSNTNNNTQAQGNQFNFGNQQNPAGNAFSFGNQQNPTNQPAPAQQPTGGFDFTFGAKPADQSTTQPATSTGGFDFNFGGSGAGTSGFSFASPTPTATTTTPAFGGGNLFDFSGSSNSSSNLSMSDPSMHAIYSNPFGTFSNAIIQGQQQKLRDTPTTPAAETAGEQKLRNPIAELLKTPAFGSNTVAAQRMKGTLSLRQKLFFKEEEETPLQILKLDKKQHSALEHTTEMKAGLLNATNPAFSRGGARENPHFSQQTQKENEESEETSADFDLDSHPHVMMFSKTLPIISKNSTTPNGVIKPTPKRPEPTEKPEDELFSEDEEENEEIAEESSEDEEYRSCVPTLTKEGYYTIPSIDEMSRMSENELSHVKNFTIGKRGIGELVFTNETDVRNLNLDEIIVFGEIGSAEVYPPEKFSEKPAEDKLLKPQIGKGLNKDAIVHLFNIFPKKNKNSDKFVEFLKKNCEKMTNNSKHLNYEAQNGKWSFSVAHF